MAPPPITWDADVDPSLKVRRHIEIPDPWDRVQDHVVCSVEIHVLRTGVPFEASTSCPEPWASIVTAGVMSWRWWPVREAGGLGAVAYERVDLFPGPDTLELAETTRGELFTQRVLRQLR